MELHAKLYISTVKMPGVLTSRKSHPGNVLWSEGLRACGGAWARLASMDGQEEQLQKQDLARGEERPGTHLPITVPELLALILWERKTSKPESYELKRWLIKLIIVQSSEFSHNELSSHESLSLSRKLWWCSSYLCPRVTPPPHLARDSSLWCLLPPKPLMGSTRFLNMKASSTEAEIMKLLGARCSSSGTS